jgi:hypothetical protein
VSSSDESVATLQLAARWAERFAPEKGDSLEAMLVRFRRAYAFADALVNDLEPPPAD